MKSHLVHLKNKYYGCQVLASDSSISVYNKAGDLLVYLKKSSHGNYICASKEYGARDKSCRAPIPKDCRAYKLYENGNIGQSEEYAERSVKAKSYVDKYGYVPSSEQLEKIAKGEADAAAKLQSEADAKARADQIEADRLAAEKAAADAAATSSDTGSGGNVIPGL